MLKVITFNIRYGLANDEENHWNNRKSLVIDRIKAFEPDLIGMQECRDDFQAEHIKNNLQGYEFYGVRRGGDGDIALEMAPILFKKSVFEIIQQGCFWLSEMPQVPGSLSWGGMFPRITMWIQLIHKESGREFIFLNTHFDYESSAIDESAKLLRKWITQTGEDQSIVLTGDFNIDKESFAYRQLTTGSGLLDVYRGIHSDNNNKEETFHGFGQAGEMTSIDWILASSHFKALSAKVDRYHDGNLYPSDHYPVTASLDWK